MPTAYAYNMGNRSNRDTNLAQKQKKSCTFETSQEGLQGGWWCFENRKEAILETMLDLRPEFVSQDPFFVPTVRPVTISYNCLLSGWKKVAFSSNHNAAMEAEQILRRLLQDEHLQADTLLCADGGCSGRFNNSGAGFHRSATPTDPPTADTLTTNK